STHHHCFHLFFFHASGHHRAPHSFPTRRSSDLGSHAGTGREVETILPRHRARSLGNPSHAPRNPESRRGTRPAREPFMRRPRLLDRKSTRLNSSHLVISYAVFCLKKKKKKNNTN